MTTNNSTFTTVGSNRASSGMGSILGGRTPSPMSPGFFDEVASLQNPEAEALQVERRLYQDWVSSRSTQRYYESIIGDPGRWPNPADPVDTARSRSMGEPPPWYESALRQTSNDAKEAFKEAKSARNAYTELSARVSELERALDQKDVVIEALETSVQEQGQLLNKLVRLLSKMKGESYVAGN